MNITTLTLTESQWIYLNRVLSGEPLMDNFGIGGYSYAEDLELKIQVWLTSANKYIITTWE